MEYRKWKDNKIIVCLTKEEIKNLLMSAKWELLDEVIAKKGWDLAEVMLDQKKMVEVAQIVSETITKDKDEVEIFVAFDSIVDFYQKGSLICFPIRATFNTNKDKITTLAILKDSIEEATLDDFIVFDGKDYRSFQMKRYRGKLETSDIGEYIVGKIQGYGDLGDRNLLVIPQSEPPFNIDFHHLNELLKEKQPAITGQILIGFNSNNEEFLLNQVYPELTTSSIPIRESVRELSKIWRKMEDDSKT